MRVVTHTVVVRRRCKDFAQSEELLYIATRTYEGCDQDGDVHAWDFMGLAGYCVVTQGLDCQ